MFFKKSLGLGLALCQLIGKSSGTGSDGVQAYEKVQFSNVGFAGTYTPVKSLKNVDSSKCSCEVSGDVWFSGTNAPMSSGVSVHFRGPLKLHQFAYYTSSNFDVTSNSTSESWSRLAYYDASSQVGENVTFLTAAGDDSPCLGKALTYAASNGTGSASSSTLIASDTLLKSDEEFMIYSNISCPSSSTKKGCGVYRKGIPAFYGFDGETKMFVFEFETPTETQSNSSSFSYYDLPAIWLLNEQIARTSQYPTNSNCSCWASGCGEFDIFEAMNGTEKNNFYSTFHTFQGIEYLGTGIQADGYIPRSTSGTMKGGVVFDSSGNTVVFMSNNTAFDLSIDAGTLNGILSDFNSSASYQTKLATISATAPSTTSKSNALSIFERGHGLLRYYVFIAVTTFTQVFLF